MKDFKKKDIVVVIGSTIKSGDRSVEYNRALCSVLAVGKYDLFVKKLRSESDYSFSSTTPFRISKKRCIKIDEQNHNHLAEIIKPCLGDLVLSFKEGRKDEQQLQIGFLLEITDSPGYGKTCKILVGEKIATVSFKSLIVLEKSKSLSKKD